MALIHRVIHHPLFEGLIGLLLVLISLDELLEDLGEDLLHGLRAGHGLALYGLLFFLLRTLEVLPYLMAGLLHLARGEAPESRGEMRRLWEKMANSPRMELTGGLLLALIAGFVAKDALFRQDAEMTTPASGHALFLFGLFSVLKYLTYLLEGLEAHHVGPFAANPRAHSLAARLSGAARSPWLHLAMAVVLVGAPLLEMGEAIGTDLLAPDPDARHGVILLGLFTFIKSAPDFYDAMEVLETEKKSSPAPDVPGE